jgi:hypothetical protein
VHEVNNIKSAAATSIILLLFLFPVFIRHIYDLVLSKVKEKDFIPNGIIFIIIE